MRKPRFSPTERKPRRLRRHEVIVLFVGYISVIYWIIRLFVYILYRVDPFIP